MNLFEVATELSRRLASIVLCDSSGKRSVFGDAEKFQNHAHWRNFLNFYEYFHGDTGEGLSASHQTAWTGLVARFVQALPIDAQATLNAGMPLLPEQVVSRVQTAGF